MTTSRLPWRKCYRCKADIWRKDKYHKQRRGKVICDKCHRPKQVKTFLIKLLERLR